MIYYQSRRPIKVSHLINSFPKQTRLSCCKFKLPLPETFTPYFHYLQIPYLSRLPANSLCKFHRATFTAKFHCLQILQYDFTVKVHYMQIPRQPIYCQNPLLSDSITCKFTHPLPELFCSIHKQFAF